MNSQDEIPYITGASNIVDNKLIINRYTNSKYTNSHVGDILISCKGTIGKIAINSLGDIHVARQFMSISTFIESEFTIIYLNTLIEQLNNNAKSMIPGIDRKQLLTKIILLPPLEEQRRIQIKVNTLLNIIAV